MAGKFANILAALGLGSDKEPVTAAHLEAADTKIAQLTQAKADADAEEKLATAEKDLKTAQDEKTKIAGDLQTASDKVTTLEKWKQAQKAVDGREEDDSNALDEDGPEAKDSWEVAASAAIASTRKRLGEK